MGRAGRDKGGVFLAALGKGIDQMRASKGRPRGAVWTLRSQKSRLQQRNLEEARDKVRVQIAFCERRIAEERHISARQTETASSGKYAIQQALSATLAGIADYERMLAAYKEREKVLTAEIEELESPSAKEAAERAKHQAALASLAIERSAKDAAIDSVLQKLRDVLAVRASLTAKMVEVAALIDFDPTADWDAGRFAALEAALPVDVFAQSRDFVSRFFGMEGEKQPYTVGRAGALLPETLADSGVYRPGETAMLSQERAELLPPDEDSHPLLGPVEMEMLAGNSFDAAERKPEEADTLPVSGFRMDSSIL